MCVQKQEHGNEEKSSQVVNGSSDESIESRVRVTKRIKHRTFEEW